MTILNRQKTSSKLTSIIGRSALVTVSCAFLLTGCATNLAHFNGVEQQTRNEVEMVRIPYNIRFADGETALSEREIIRLNHFLRTSNITHGDEFSMDFPLDRNGELSETDTKRLTYLSNLLKDSGLYLSGGVTPYGTEPSVNEGRLLITKYVVTTPECGDWSQKPYPNHENAPISNLGCANQANLGLMVANPRDLIIGETGASVNAERMAGAVERYRNRTIVVERATTGSTEN